MMDFTRQRLGKHFRAETNTHARMKELFDVVFFMPSVSYKIPQLVMKGSRRLILPITFCYSVDSAWSRVFLNEITATARV
jgi:hypothetical protein